MSHARGCRDGHGSTKKRPSEVSRYPRAKDRRHIGSIGWRREGGSWQPCPGHPIASLELHSQGSHRRTRNRVRYNLRSLSIPLVRVSTELASHKYIYSPLDIYTREIRLLTLYAGQPGDKIICSLETILSGEQRNTYGYEALSYAWGTSEEGKHEINLGGQPFFVLNNLYWALVNIRKSDKNRILWIDSICINQSNDEEKNHQVAQMHRIFRGANQVIVWLGKESSTSKAALSCIYSNVFRHIEDGVLELCSRPYWERVWIVQEIGLARKLIVQCGPDQIPWACLVRFWVRLKRVADQRSVSAKENDPVNDRITKSLEEDILDCNSMRIVSQRVHRVKSACLLLPLLIECSSFKCYDKRDKIYGFLGLASDASHYNVPISYSSSLHDVQLAFFRSVSLVEQRKKWEDKQEQAHPAKLFIFLSELLEDGSESNCPSNDFDETPPVLCVPACCVTRIHRFIGPPTKDNLSGYDKSILQQYQQVSFNAIVPIESASSYGELDHSIIAQLEERYSDIISARDTPARQAGTPQRNRYLQRLRAVYPDFQQHISDIAQMISDYTAACAMQPVSDDVAEGPLVFQGHGATLGVACKGAMVRDLVCKLANVDTTLILRPEHGRLRIIGRGIYMQSQLDKVEADYIGTRSQHPESDPSPKCYPSLHRVAKLLAGHKTLQDFYSRNLIRNTLCPLLLRLDYRTWYNVMWMSRLESWRSDAADDADPDNERAIGDSVMRLEAANRKRNLGSR